VVCADKSKELLSELKLTNKSASFSDKTLYGNSTANKYNLAGNFAINDSNTEQKVLEKKQIFPSQTKAALAGAVNAAVYMRDDLRGRTKYPHGTINAEIPQKNNVKNPIFPPTYPPSKFQPNQETVGASANIGAIIAGAYLVPDETLMPCKNPSVEVSQPLQSRSSNVQI